MTPVDGWTSWLIQVVLILALCGTFAAFIWWSDREYDRWLDRMYGPKQTSFQESSQS